MTNRDQLFCELMKEAQEGNATSYETLLAEVYVFLQSYLGSKIFNKSQIDDVVQEVLLSIHKARHTFDTSKSFMSWMLAIAHYKTADHLRIQFKDKFQELDETLIDSAPSAFNSLSEHENRQILEAALNELEKKPREVLTLLKLEGLKISEVAARMNLTESNVKVIAHRAYQSLAVQLRGKL